MSDVVIQVCLVPVFESNVVKQLIVSVCERIVILHAIVSIIEALYVGRVIVVDGMAELRFAVCLRLDWREGDK